VLRAHLSRVQGSGFRVSGFGFRVSGFGFRVSGFGCRGEERFRISSSGGVVRVSGSGVRAWDVVFVMELRGSGFRFQSPLSSEYCTYKAVKASLGSKKTVFRTFEVFPSSLGSGRPSGIRQSRHV